MAFLISALQSLEVVCAAHRLLGCIVSNAVEILRLVGFGGPSKLLISQCVVFLNDLVMLMSGLRYASVAFGLPCAIDDSDCDVPEIDGSLSYTMAAGVSTVTPLTYHIFKGRLYRIMGPFLGRRKQTNRLRGLLDVHRALTTWYATVPDILKCGTSSLELDGRPILMQMQAIALQLAYDNLQMVLFRHAVFTKDPVTDPDPQRTEGIRQLSQSATRTADISNFTATSTICASSHAAMHVGICSFTAGVVLCALVTHQPDNPDKQLWLASLKKLITLFERFPSETYRLATQSLQLLKALELRVGPNAMQRSVEAETFSILTQTSELTLDIPMRQSLHGLYVPLFHLDLLKVMQIYPT